MFLPDRSVHAHTLRLVALAVHWTVSAPPTFYGNGPVDKYAHTFGSGAMTSCEGLALYQRYSQISVRTMAKRRRSSRRHLSRLLRLEHVPLVVLLSFSALGRDMERCGNSSVLDRRRSHSCPLWAPRSVGCHSVDRHCSRPAALSAALSSSFQEARHVESAASAGHAAVSSV